MRKTFTAILLFVAVTGLVQPPDCPAPLIWRRGEGWVYEKHGVTTGRDPEEQLAIARRWQEQEDYSNAIASYRRLVRRWPTSAAVEEARLGMAESLAAYGYHYQAFEQYQALIEQHPASDHFETALENQFKIGNLFMAGERYKAYGIRWFPTRDKAIEIYKKVVKNGPYSKVGPQAQYRIGLAHEQRQEYILAVHAYERLLERYPDHELAETAQYQIGYAYQQQAGRAEYDQNTANQAIDAYADFVVRYPDSPMVAQAEEARTGLSHEQARGLYQIGAFYEHMNKYSAALIYYNDAIEHSPQSEWAAAAKEKVVALTPRLERETAPPATANP